MGSAGNGRPVEVRVVEAVVISTLNTPPLRSTADKMIEFHLLGLGADTRPDRLKGV
jgi:hypothetical protein